MSFVAMTYNIQSGRNLARQQDIAQAASVIRSVQPDFVTLNEVRSHTQDVGAVAQADALGRLTGYYPVFGKAIDVDGGEYGNALLTRLPLMESEVIHIPDPERTGEGWYEHRAVLRCVVEADGAPITVLCVHFGLMPEEQALAVETVLRLTERESNPVMLMGDFNLTPDAAALQPILKIFRDSGALQPSLKTWPSDAPDQKIDYIFCTAPLTFDWVRSMDTQCSDHRPLIVRARISE